MQTQSPPPHFRLYSCDDAQRLGHLTKLWPPHCERCSNGTFHRLEVIKNSSSVRLYTYIYVHSRKDIFNEHQTTKLYWPHHIITSLFRPFHTTSSSDHTISDWIAIVCLMVSFILWNNVHDIARFAMSVLKCPIVQWPPVSLSNTQSEHSTKTTKIPSLAVNLWANKI